MKNLYKIPLFILFGLLPFLSACGQTQKDTTQQGSQSGNSYFSSLNQQMQKIDSAFNKESNDFSTEARQTYQHMQRLWTTMQARHSQMMRNGGGMGQGMMGRGMMGNRGNAAGMRTRMMSYLGKMQQMMSQSGHPNMASMFGQMRNKFGNIQPGGSGATGTIPDSTTASASGNNAQPTIDGKRLFLNTCAPCHGSNANGMAGAFPPLNGSPIVAGKKETVIKIVLDGLEGPLKINGSNYNSMMPTFGNSYNDAQIAGILTYLRSLPKNKASKITAQEVKNVRKEIAGHSGYWSPKELGIK